jgi:LPPG:FO 2-phospho-L-lactate transferase
MPCRFAVLAGGIGASRFLQGLIRAVPAADITVVGNTGDDFELHGLSVSPDLDTVTYTLAGWADPERGWGIAGDTFRCLETLGKFTGQTWFQLGDRDLATHIYRSSLLRGGFPLSEVTARIVRALGVQSSILPMSDQRVRTWIETPAERLDFQTYFVKHKAQDEIRGIEFVGADNATPAPGVLEVIAAAEAVILAPSNPIISIGPILAVPGVREALAETSAQVAAVTPIVAGRALKGPAARMMEALGHESSALGVARIYRDFLDVLILDEQDRHLTPSIENLGVRTVVTNTIMSDLARKESLARAVLEAVAR